ncbi:hypothetical protein [Nocardioides silvaticus]|nr:hypothetical protein [Nocardioides silvaticus]
MSQHEEESDGTGITDDQLPEDLVPSEDNPLAEGLPPGEEPDEDLLTSGKDAEGSGDEGSDEQGAESTDES